MVSAILALGCSSQPPSVDPARVRAEVEEGLALTLREVGPAQNPTLSSVAATFAGSSSNESILVLIFNAPEATQQVTSDARTASAVGRVIREGPVVVVYTHRDGTIDRSTAIRRALRRALPSA